MKQPLKVICDLRVHCRSCRTNAQFRKEVLARQFELPEGGIERCPFGVDHVGSPAGERSSTAVPASISGLAMLARDFDGIQSAERIRLDDFQDRLHSRAKDQFKEFRKNHPEDLSSRLSYRRWALRCINFTANKARGIPPLAYHVAAQQHGWVIVPDRVVCLSLDSREDRWQAFSDSCKRSKYLSSWRIERYRAKLPNEMIIPDFWIGEHASHFATKQDHLDMFKQSYVAGHETIMIFEDDAIIRGSFDAAYESACAELPREWLGLWLTSNGHVTEPVKHARHLDRSTSQVMLHAYMLSRRGMHRTWSHITCNPGQVIDGATSTLHGIEPHFYSVTRNAVIQTGQREASVGSDRPRTDFYNRAGRYARRIAARKSSAKAA